MHPVRLGTFRHSYGYDVSVWVKFQPKKKFFWFFDEYLPQTENKSSVTAATRLQQSTNPSLSGLCYVTVSFKCGQSISYKSNREFSIHEFTHHSRKLMVVLKVKVRIRSPFSIFIPYTTVSSTASLSITVFAIGCILKTSETNKYILGIWAMMS